MGNSSETILYDCGSKYIGEVSNKIPHGKGVVWVKKSSPSFNNKLAVNND